MGPLYSALIAGTVVAAALLAAFVAAAPFTGARTALVYATAGVGGGLVGVIGVVACIHFVGLTNMVSHEQVVGYLLSLGLGFVMGGSVATLLLRRWRIRRRESGASEPQSASTAG